MPQNIDIEQLKYPIGRYVYPENADDKTIIGWIDEIEELPVQIKSVVNGLNDNQLNTPYRPGSWTARQVIHHFNKITVSVFLNGRFLFTTHLRNYNC